MTLTDAGKVRNTEIARELCLPPVKRMFSISFLPSPPPPNPCLFEMQKLAKANSVFAHC